MKARILEEGPREASQCIAVGASTGALPLLLGGAALGFGLVLRKKKPS